MCLLIETIKVSERRFLNLAFHNERMNSARRKLLGCKDSIGIAESLNVPSNLGNDVFKCTVSYGQTIVKVEFKPYSIPKIKNLMIIRCDTIDYSFKYADRSELNNLFNLRGWCDEILIVKDGLITDTSFTNIIFNDGKKWVTPEKPLLKGTKRENLLKKGLIKEAAVSLEDLTKFNEACLINAMLEIGDIRIDTKNIYKL